MAKRRKPAKRPGQARRARAEPRRQRGARAFERAAAQDGGSAPAAVPGRRTARRGRPARAPAVYFWSDRSEQVYVVLRDQAGHWRLEWGSRTPPASDNYVPGGKHVTSDRDEAVRLTVDRIHRLSDDPVLAARTEAELRAAVQPDRSVAG